MAMTGNSYSVPEVGNFQIFNYSTGELLMKVSMAMEVKVTGDAQEKTINGGIGNPSLMSFYHSKSGKFTAKLPIVTMDCLGVKFGNKMKKGVGKAKKFETLTVDATNKIKLSQTPLTGTLTVNKGDSLRDIGDKFIVGTPASDPTSYSITGSDIQFNTAVAQGTQIDVAYEYATGTNSSSIRFTAGDMPPLISIVCETPIEDEQGFRCTKQIRIYKAKVSPKFDMTLKSGSPTELDFECTSYADRKENGTFFELIKLGDEDAITY